MLDKLNKKVVFVASGMAATLMPAIVFAEESSGTANTAVVTALTDTANDMMQTGASLVPVAIGVVGLILAVRFGIKFFKQIAK